MSTTSQGLSLPASSWVDPTSPALARRRVSARAAQGIELLRHAIQYLASEAIRDSIPPALQRERMQALKLLMDLNREVYFECPVAPTFAERCRRLFRLA
jgi:hypothetical protein